MQESDVKVVRGVSIAAIVLSILGILGCLMLVILFATGGVIAGDPSHVSGYVEHRDDLGFTHGLDSQYSLDAVETSAALAAVFGVLGVLSGFGIVLCAVSLVAGIMGVRNARNPQKVGSIFGWSIAGAICSLLMLRVVSCVLLIVNAVYAHRLRKETQHSSYAPYQSVGVQQPVSPQYAAPQQVTMQQPLSQQPVSQPFVSEQQPISSQSAYPAPPAVPQQSMLQQSVSAATVVSQQPVPQQNASPSSVAPQQPLLKEEEAAREDSSGSGSDKNDTTSAR